MTTCIAVPFNPFDPAKLSYIVSRCCEHRAWFGDYDWELGEAHRRSLVLRRFADLDTKSWEVYRGEELVGILQADEIVPRTDCRAHFLFFDHQLHDKRALCLNTMEWLYLNFQLHTIRLEIPTYAAKLIGFTRKALGFRFEAEGRAFSWPSSAAPLAADVAKLGSRKHHAIFHQGEWHDLLLLSQTDDEFRAMKANHDRPDHQAAPSHRALAPTAIP